MFAQHYQFVTHASNCKLLIIACFYHVIFSFHSAFVHAISFVGNVHMFPLTHLILLRLIINHYLRVRSSSHLQKSMHDPYLFPIVFHIIFYSTYRIYFNYLPDSPTILWIPWGKKHIVLISVFSEYSVEIGT